MKATITAMCFLTASVSYGWTWTTSPEPTILLAPGQCVKFSRTKVCAVKAYKVVLKREPTVEEVGYECRPGAISDNLLGWFLMHGKERVSVFKAEEKVRCLAELGEVTD